MRGIRAGVVTAAIASTAILATTGVAAANPPYFPPPQLSVSQIAPESVVVPVDGDGELQLRIHTRDVQIFTLSVHAPTGTAFSSLPDTRMCEGSTATDYKCDFNGPGGPYEDPATGTVRLSLRAVDPATAGWGDAAPGGWAHVTGLGPFATTVDGGWIGLHVVFAPRAVQPHYSALSLELSNPDGSGARTAAVVCDPDLGSVQDPRTACDQLATARGNFDRLPPVVNVLCMDYVRPVMARSAGVWRGRAVAWSSAVYSNICQLRRHTGVVFRF